MMTKISSTSTELGYQLQQQQQNEQIYSNQLMLSSTPPSINCYRKIRSTEDLTTMLTDETTMTTLQQHQSQHLQDHSNLKFSTLNTPATIVDENNHNARALQLALELSIVSLNSEHQNHSMNSSQRLLLNSSIDHQSISKSTNSIMTSNLTQPLQNEHQFQKSFLENSSLALGMIEERTKKSQNMTECVPVPSSEHVAEIVGRQGCKIKALRAKTNTYIKTPVRGEEPVFVVTGRKEDVAKAKREILSAAEHFSLIRAARNPSRQTFTPNATTILPPINDIDCNSENLLDENKLTTHIDASIFKLNESNEKQQQQQQQQSQQQQITIQVRVPYRVVGLVVGPKGSTIKHIQQETQTYIVTPSREKQPIFEVTGSHENVQLARKQIEAHIAIRTGNLSNSLPPTATPTIYGGTGSGTRIQNQKLCKTIEDDIDYEKNVCLYRSNHNHDEMTLNEFLNDMTTMSSTTSTSTTSATSTETTICTINSLSQMLNEGENLQPEFLETFYRTFDYKENNIQQLREQHQQLQPSRPQQIFKLEKSDNDVFYNEQEQQLNQFLKAQQKQLTSSQTVATTTTTTTTATTMAALLNFNARSSSSASSSTSSKSAQNCYIAVGDNGGLENGVGGGFATNWKHNLGDSLDTDEGISESSLIWVLPTTSSGITTTTLTQSMVSTSTTTAPNTTSTAISPTDSLLCHSSSSSNEIHQNHSQNIFYAKSQQQQQQQQQQPQFKRDSCLICGYQEVSAALIPCGHDLFCLDCAQHICSSLEPNCPICNNNVYQAVRLTS